MSTQRMSTNKPSNTSISSQSGSNSNWRGWRPPTFELVRDAGLLLLGAAAGYLVSEYVKGRYSEKTGSVERDAPILGHLFNYNKGGKYRLIAHESTMGDFSYSDTEYYVVFIGGLSDGIYPHEWIPEFIGGVSETLAKKGRWSAVTITLSSSGMGFGHQSLRKDVKELDILINYLRENRPSFKGVVFIGHSTGCQDLVTLAKHTTNANHIKAIVLQAPVSDREAEIWELKKQSRSTNADELDEQMFREKKRKFERTLQKAADKIQEGARAWSERLDKMTPQKRGKMESWEEWRKDVEKGREMMDRDDFWAPITAYRYYSLHAEDGADNLFPTYQSERLVQLLGHIHIPTLLVWSGSDEYVDVETHSCIEDHLQKMRRIINGPCDYHIIPSANHSLKKPPAAVQSFATKFAAFVQKLDLA